MAVLYVGLGFIALAVILNLSATRDLSHWKQGKRYKVASKVAWVSTILGAGCLIVFLLSVYLE